MAQLDHRQLRMLSLSLGYLLSQCTPENCSCSLCLIHTGTIPWCPTLLALMASTAGKKDGLYTWPLIHQLWHFVLVWPVPWTCIANDQETIWASTIDPVGLAGYCLARASISILNQTDLWSSLHWTLFQRTSWFSTSSHASVGAFVCPLQDKALKRPAFPLPVLVSI